MERPRRRIWQIQLPTAIALMVAAAFLIHLNTACKGVVHVDNDGCGTLQHHVDEFGYGFPYLAYIGEPTRGYASYASLTERLRYIREEGEWHWNRSAAAIDAFCACLLLITVAIVSEKLLPPPKLARDWSKLRRETRWPRRGAGV